MRDGIDAVAVRINFLFSHGWKGAERPVSFFPMIGKIVKKVSNDWKNAWKSFQ